MTKKVDLLPSEHEEQKQVMAWASMMATRYPILELLFAIPNGGHRHIGTAKKLKAEGQKPGLPDLCLAVARDEYHGLFIELKRRKGGRVTYAQSCWHTRLREQGYKVEVCRGADEAIEVISMYLGIKQ